MLLTGPSPRPDWRLYLVCRSGLMRPADAQLFHLRSEGAGGKTQHTGSAGSASHDPVSLLEDPGNVLALYRPQIGELNKGLYSRLFRRESVGPQRLFQFEHRPGRGDQCALHDAFELANVSWPVIATQFFQHLAGDCLDGLAKRGSVLAHEVLREQRNIALAFS